MILHDHHDSEKVAIESRLRTLSNMFMHCPRYTESCFVENTVYLRFETFSRFLASPAPSSSSTESRFLSDVGSENDTAVACRHTRLIRSSRIC